MALLIGIVGANSLLFARFIAWHGDQAWGPRYMQIVLPCAVAIAAPLLAGPGRRWFASVVAAGVIGFAGPGLLGVLIYPNAYFQQGNAELTSRLDPDGQRHYINQFHFNPYWSPLLGHARRVPSTLATTAHRLNGPTDDLQPFPSGPTDRYFWFDFLNQVDVWWLWLPAARLPRWLLIIVPALGGGAALGARQLYRGRGPSDFDRSDRLGDRP